MDKTEAAGIVVLIIVLMGVTFMVGIWIGRSGVINHLETEGLKPISVV